MCRDQPGRLSSCRHPAGSAEPGVKAGANSGGAAVSQAEMDELREQVRNLADRVSQLEALLTGRPDTSFSQKSETDSRPAPAAHGGVTTVLESASTLPVLGTATLGLAGAYLLRAIAETGVLPTRLVFATATLYALAWLLWAARVAAKGRLATTLYSLTAAIILSPLLWEATVRFHTVDPRQSSLILVAFTLAGLAVSWHRDLLIVATIAVLAGIGTAAALLIATDDLMPFIFVFLAMAAAVETCACLNHWLGERWLTAAVADLSVLLATWVVTRPEGLPQGYAPIARGELLAAQTALLLIYLSSIMVRTLVHGRAFTNFETAQCVLSFLIGLGGAMRLASASNYQLHIIAGLALLCGAVCYAISVPARQGLHRRNFYTYSTFGILLVLAGCKILLPGDSAAAAWFVLALACLGAGGLLRSMTLQVHGAVYLLLGLILSGAMHDSARLLLGADVWPVSVSPAIWVGAGVAAASYLLAIRSSRPVGENWNSNALRVVMGAAVVWLALGLVAGRVSGIYHQLFAVPAGDAYCATLRTGTVVIFALILAGAGSRRSFRALSQLVYPVMLLGGYRLLTQDLRQERKSVLFLSLLLYGATLIALPRLRRARRKPLD